MISHEKRGWTVRREEEKIRCWQQTLFSPFIFILMIFFFFFSFSSLFHFPILSSRSLAWISGILLLLLPHEKPSSARNTIHQTMDRVSGMNGKWVNTKLGRVHTHTSYHTLSSHKLNKIHETEFRNNWKSFFPRTNVFWLYYLLRTMSNERWMCETRDDVGSASHQLESLIAILVKSHSARDAVSRILSASNVC